MFHKLYTNINVLFHFNEEKTELINKYSISE